MGAGRKSAAGGRVLGLFTRRRRPRPQAAPPARDCATAGHRFGVWLACACAQSVRDHRDPAGPGGFFGDGSCAFEFRSCASCRADQERHIADVPTVPCAWESTGRHDQEQCDRAHRAERAAEARRLLTEHPDSVRPGNREHVEEQERRAREGR